MRALPSASFCRISPFEALNSGTFADRDELPVGVNLADAARNRAMLGESVVEPVARHCEARTCRRGNFQELANHFIRFAAVKIVGIDGCEGLGDGLSRAPDGMRGSPRFRSIGGNRKSVGKKIKLLKDVVDSDVPFVARANLLPELRLDVAPDNEDNPLKSHPQSVGHRVIEESFPRRPHGVHLLQSAVAAAHSGGENKESEFRHAAKSC